MQRTQEQKNKDRKKYLRNREHLIKISNEARARRYKERPWLRFLSHAKSRCTHKDKYKNYGGRDIKFLLTEEEIRKIWFRDKAYSLKKPSIDRKDNEGNYEYDNCRFIEFSKNCGHRRKKSNYDNKQNSI